MSIRVRDIRKSAEFYCELFGLELRPAVPPGDSACLCAAPAASSYVSFGIALIQGLPEGTDPIGVDHISFEVPSADDVADIYCSAASRGIPATEPRLYGGFYQTFVFDPDGYKIEVLASEPTGIGDRTIDEGAHPTTHATGDAFSVWWSQRVRRETSVLFGHDAIDDDALLGGKRHG